MCGIVGYFSFNRNPINPDNIYKMLNAIRHRGPDDTGIAFFNTNTRKITDVPYGDAYDGVIGFQRLSIRELSSNGHQPLISKGKNVILAFNGEIFNTDELCKNELGLDKCIHCDTQVLLELYLKYGIDKTLALINGIYSIVIYDFHLETLYLIRDRFGTKPLYYSFTSNGIVFASEQKALFEHPAIRKRLNLFAVPEIIMFRSPFPGNYWENIDSVPSGSYLSIKNHSTTIHKHFNLEQFHRIKQSDISYSEAKEKLLSVLDNVIKQQLISDKPVGVQLSGGVDSSMISFFAGKHDPGIAAFSIYIDDESLTEKEHIKNVANLLNLNHNACLYSEKKAVHELRRVSNALDMVNTHFNALGLYHLAEIAKSKVSVLLTGEGADELFGGYYQFAEGVEVSKYIKSRSYTPEKDEDYFGCYPNSYASYAILKDMHVSYQTYLKAVKLEKENHMENRARLFDSFDCDEYDRHLRYEISTHLTDLLVKQDKVAMANSIETRIPFLDNRLTEFALTMPKEFFLNKYNNTVTGKYILKDICSDIFGQAFSFRRKMGFPHPIKNYLKVFLGQESSAVILEQLRQFDWINHDEIRNWLQNLDNLDNEQIIVIWKLIHFCFLTEK